jgi:hypothetical protein
MAAEHGRGVQIHNQCQINRVNFGAATGKKTADCRIDATPGR